jgi:hypothetical protein
MVAPPYHRNAKLIQSELYVNHHSEIQNLDLKKTDKSMERSVRLVFEYAAQLCSIHIRIKCSVYLPTYIKLHPSVFSVYICLKM